MACPICNSPEGSAISDGIRAGAIVLIAVSTIVIGAIAPIGPAALVGDVRAAAGGCTWYALAMWNGLVGSIRMAGRVYPTLSELARGLLRSARSYSRNFGAMLRSRQRRDEPDQQADRREFHASAKHRASSHTRARSLTGSNHTPGSQ